MPAVHFAAEPLDSFTGEGAGGSESAGFRLEAQFAPASGTWTDLTPDVLVAPGVQWFRGIRGPGPEDRTAATGTLAWSLRNFDVRHPSSTLGWYSPWSTKCRAGWGAGIHVRLVAVTSGGDVPLWRGFVETIDPDPGIKGTRAVRCTALDVMKRWADTPIPAVAVPINSSLATTVQAISDAAPAPLYVVDPIAGALVSLDPDSDTLETPCRDAGPGVFAMTLLQRAVQSGLAYQHIAADGTFTTESRHARPLRSTAFVLNDSVLLADRGLSVPSDLAGVFNRFGVTVHQVTPSMNAEQVLYASPTVIYVDPGQTLTFLGRYVDQSNTVKPLSGTDAQPLLYGTDYVGNSAPDGRGADLTASIVISATAGTDAVQFVITNTGSARVYFVDGDGAPRLQLRGRALADNGPLRVEASAAHDYGDRPYEIDLPYIGDANFAETYAQYLVAQYENPVQVLEAAPKPRAAPSAITAALTLEIGQVVEISETVTGISSVQGYVQSVSGEIKVPNLVQLRWGLTPRQVSISTAWAAGIAAAGVDTVPGF